MAIPASVTLYVDWKNGSLASSTYTSATPDVPSGHEFNFRFSTITTESGAPWNGQMLATFPVWYTYIDATVSAATTPTTQGRFLVELNEADTGTSHIIMLRHAADEWDGHIWFQKTGGNLQVEMGWNNDGSSSQVSLGTYPTVPYAIEVIYDSTNATANQRLRARWWPIGDTPGAFVDAGSGHGSAAAMAEFTELRLADEDNVGLKFGRIIFSDDIGEDLSLVNEAAGASSLVARRPFPRSILMH